MSRERLRNHRAKRHYLQSAARRATSSPHNKGEHGSGDWKHHSLIWMTKRKGGNDSTSKSHSSNATNENKMLVQVPPLPILRGDVSTIRREWGYLSLGRRAVRGWFRLRRRCGRRDNDPLLVGGCLRFFVEWVLSPTRAVSY